MKSTKSSFWSTRKITMVSFVSFCTVFFLLIGSNQYMKKCIEKEETTRYSINEMKQESESLSEASDYLTNAVRSFAATKDINYLYNYWYDVKVDKTRDKIIDKLFMDNLSKEEENLLKEAKTYSDTLMNQETKAMKLILLSMGMTEDNYSYNEKLKGYVHYVMGYDRVDYSSYMTSEQMQLYGISILYNQEYLEYKTLIRSPILEFQKVLDVRSSEEMARAVDGRAKASIIQVYSSVAVVIMMAILILAIYKLYALPIRKYVEKLMKSNVMSNVENNELEKIVLKPDGVKELQELGIVFNGISVRLRNELEVRRQTELEMIVARDEADKANGAKSQFLARMSHELRTPLNAMIGYLYLFSNTSMDDTQKRYIEKISYSSESLLGLINNILDFSKIESGNISIEIVDFNIIELLKEIYAVIENSANKKNLKFDYDIDGNLPMYVRGDQLKLRQILLNLLGNALKFTSDGFIRLSAYMKNNGEEGYDIEFKVSDSGIGIDDEEQDRILKPFSQSDAAVERKYGGTGLGLSISKMLVEELSNNKETLWIESKKGEGSTFGFLIHFTPGNKREIQDSSKDIFLVANVIKDQVSSSILKDKKILVVDDNEINVTMEKEILNNFGLDVSTAMSGMEAIEKTQAEKFDMILLDIRMTGMDGYETASHIRCDEKYRYVPIIALTADVVAGVEDKVKASGMNDYITKPINPFKLNNIIGKYFQIYTNMPEQLSVQSSMYFSLNECMMNVRNNKKLLIKMVNKFIQGQKKSAVYIKAHIDSGYYSNASRILHDVIGLSGNLCCHMLYDSSENLKELLDSRNVKEEELRTMTNKFNQVWDNTITELELFLERNKEEQDNAELQYQKNPEELFDKLKKACEEFDIGAVDMFENNKKLIYKQLPESTYKSLENAIEIYDFDKASNIMSAIEL